jgi:hypothetical protein
LNGLAGTGKSTIAQTIAERIFADGRLGASFFCSRDFKTAETSATSSPLSPSNSLTDTPNFDQPSSLSSNRNSDIVHESLYNQMDTLIVGPLASSGISRSSSSMR